jgi:hypothetical protein
VEPLEVEQALVEELDADAEVAEGKRQRPSEVLGARPELVERDVDARRPPAEA